ALLRRRIVARPVALDLPLEPLGGRVGRKVRARERAAVLGAAEVMRVVPRILLAEVVRRPVDRALGVADDELVGRFLLRHRYSSYPLTMSGSCIVSERVESSSSLP